MPFLLRNLTLHLGESEELLLEKIIARFSLQRDDITHVTVVRKGVDARKKPQVKLVYTVEFGLADEERFRGCHAVGGDLEYVGKKEAPVFKRNLPGNCKRIVIAGMGPAGLFAGLRLAEHGLTATIFERGKPVEERLKDVQAFWSRGVLDPASNVQFGEGGAGTFSDGKLTTRVRDVNLSYVLTKLVQFGAPAEILVAAKPHIGTDRLRRVVATIRRYLEFSGFTICFGGQLTDIRNGGGRLTGIEINGYEEHRCDALVLAPGHSARDTYEMLQRRSVAMELKPFAVGVRVEHPQELINLIQYGMASHPQLPPADYALAYNNPGSGRSAYSFCMCPGGVVVAGASEEGGVVTNGMSGYLRNSPYANSALVVTVGRSDFSRDDPLAGVEFQRYWERKAFHAAGGDYRAPAQNLMAFLGEKGAGKFASSYRPGVREVDLSRVLPESVCSTLREGVRYFERKMRGFITAEATLTGVETRTSAPLRILRGDDMQAQNVKGLYPAGEGAGYAGGIMSAALDGIRVADAIAERVKSEE
jgi:uncharacterized FAD-dependent dehydrogenase